MIYSLSAALFLYRFRDMIDTVRQPDGTRKFINVGKAFINGLELEAHKFLGHVSVAAGYTYLDHRNQTDARPLDTIPRHSGNIMLTMIPLKDLRTSLSGIFSSRASWFDVLTGITYNIPSFFQLDAVVSFQAGRWEVFLKAANLFNKYFYTEPGFPWRGRYFEAGFRVAVLE